MAQKIHSSIRINESEKKVLDDYEVSVLRAVRIGIMSLKYAAQIDSGHPCIYLARTGNDHSLPAGPLHQEGEPPAHCCPACPIRNSMPKRYPAALKTTGQKENAVMIERSEPDPCIITLTDLVIAKT